MPQPIPVPSPVAVSFVLGTRGRSAQLATTLEYWAQVRSDALWELVVVDNNSDDQTWELLQTWTDRLPLRPVRERMRGVTRARNTGVGHASGALIAFVDDDCYPAPDLVDAWLRVFADPRVDYSAGRVELFDDADLPITIKTSLDPIWYVPSRLIPPGEIHSASMAVRREVFFGVGRFDPDLGPGTPFRSGDDTEFFQRASLLGYCGRYSPEAVIWHHHGRREADYPGLQRGYDLGTGGAFGAIAVQLPGAAWRLVLGEVARSGGVRPFSKRVYWWMRGHGRRSLGRVGLAAARFAWVTARRGRRVRS